jgi:hypothetical protein
MKVTKGGMVSLNASNRVAKEDEKELCSKTMRKHMLISSAPG